MEKDVITNKLPQTDSIQELTQFWDTHDLTEFEHELEEVTEPVFERQTVLKIPVSSQQADAIQRLAQSKGMDIADLIRTWLLEKVQTP